MPIVTKTLGEGTQSVLLTVAILETLAQEKDPVTISDLARSIGTSKSRVFRHLRTLLACDYVTQDVAGGRYGAGTRLQALCQPGRPSRDLGTLAVPYMERLCRTFRHSVIVSRIESDGVHVVRSMSGHANIVLEVRSGTVLPFDSSAQGQTALAFTTASRSGDTRGIDSSRSRFSRKNPGALAAIRSAGLAAAQMRDGLLGIAAPIFGEGDRAVGTLALLDTVGEMQRDQTEAGAALKSAAVAISRELGHAGLAEG